MNTGKGQVLELILEDVCRLDDGRRRPDGRHQVRIACPAALIPSPGQYLLASDGSASPLPVPLFHTNSAPDGFIAVGPLPETWRPGLVLYLRGPLGRGFTLPAAVRKVGLVALGDSPARLKGLIGPALKQDAAVVLVCNSASDSLPDEVEVQPLSALQEIAQWADYLAFDVIREDLNELRERLGKRNPLLAEGDAQILVHTPVPCGGMADCGICAVKSKSDWQLACKDGPVFNWSDLLE